MAILDASFVVDLLRGKPAVKDLMDELDGGKCQLQFVRRQLWSSGAAPA